MLLLIIEAQKNVPLIHEFPDLWVPHMAGQRL